MLEKECDEAAEAQAGQAPFAEGHLPPLDSRNNQVNKHAFEDLILLKSLQ